MFIKEHLTRILPNNRFARSVSILAGGTATGQFIVVAASPLLTRLYSPDDFGLLAVYAGLLSILSVIASLRYQLAIPLPENEKEAASAVVLSILVVLGMTALSTSILGTWGETITNALNTPALAPYLWLIPTGLFLTGIYQVFSYWAIRTNAFPVIARTKLTQALGMVIVQLVGYTLGPVALLIGHVTGRAAGTTSLGALLYKDYSIFQQVTLTDICKIGFRHKRFPLYSSWGGLFNTTGVQLPPILFAALFNPAAAGIYMLAHRVLAMPMELLGRAIAHVFFSSAATANRDGELAPLVSGIHSKLAHIAMPPALILLLAAPDLFQFVFGANWQQAGDFAQWMVPFLYIQFITSPLSTVHSVVEKQAQGTLFHGLLLFVRISGLVVGAFLDSVIIAVALFALGSAICWIGFLLWILHISSVKAITTALKTTQSALFWSILIVLPLLLTWLFYPSNPAVLVATLASSLLVLVRYYMLLKEAY